MNAKTTVSFFLVLAAVMLMAFTIPQEQKKPGPWEIPAEYKKMENPFKDDASSSKLGKALYAKHCRSCHGNTGEGDGPKAKNLETWPGDFSTAEFHEYTDGELYYMTVFGRDEMPKFEDKVTDEEGRWALVNYVRTLKK